MCFQKWHEEFGKFSFAGWKNINFILESKMVGLNQNQNSEQPDRIDTAWNIYFGNKWIAQLTKLFTHVLQNRCS